MNGTLKIKIEGLNASKVINKLIDSGIYLKNIREKYKFIVFEIDERDEKEFKEVCKKLHKRYEVLSKNNLCELIKRSRFYFGFLMSFVLIFSLVFSFNLFVHQIDLKVSNNVSFDVTKVEKLLKEEGVVSGMKKKDINKLELQNLIVASDESVAGCSIKQIGGKLEIEIIPAVLKDEVKKGNLYSNYNAVVSGINVFAGKTSLKIGDLVKKGDLLIENDNGAIGEVFGKVYFSDCLIYNENQKVKEYTGNVIEGLDFVLFGKNLNKRKQNIKFLNFTEENCVFYVSKYNFLPLKLVKTKYREFNYKDVVIRFSEKENELKEKLYSEVFNKLDKKFKDKITNVTYSVVTENNLTRLDCFIECEINLVSA